MLYQLCVALHVLAAITAFGGIAVVPLLRRHAGDGVAAARVERDLARRVVTPAMTVSLVTGLVQVATGPYAFGDVWVDSGLTVLLALFALMGAGVTRDAKALVAMGEGSDAAGSVGAEGTVTSPEWGARRRRLDRWWILAAVLATIAVLLMELRPG